MIEEINQALALKEKLDALRPLSAEVEARVMQKLRLDWNYHSNHIEGNSLTFGETKSLLLFGVTAKGKPLKDHLEIKGHDEAIDLIFDILKDERPLTENFIRELHQLILKEPYLSPAQTPEGQKTYKKIQIGEYKTMPNHVLTPTGKIFYFATPEETPAKMHDLMLWFRTEKEKSTVNPIILAAEFHYRFVTIHPFDDGNGRLARILMNFILMQFGFPPTIIRTEDRTNYLQALSNADKENLDLFIIYIAENVIDSLEIMLKIAEGKMSFDDLEN